LDLNGAGFELNMPDTNELLARGHVCNVMVGHVVLQVLSRRTEPQHEGKLVQIRAAAGPWDKLTVPIWPIEKQSVNCPPPVSLSTNFGVTHYGHFRSRFENATGHKLITLKKPR
jgi:hypothetical protein